MEVEKLVRMANQIEAFFRGEVNPEDAVAGIENHLRRYWEPRMRLAIIEHSARGGEGLGDLARRAVQKLSASTPG